MTKRTRKKPQKHQASEHATKSPSDALQQAVDEFKDSATHLFETAWSELQTSAVALVEGLRTQAQKLFASLKPNGTSGKPSNGRESDARTHGPSVA